MILVGHTGGLQLMALTTTQKYAPVVDPSRPSVTTDGDADLPHSQWGLVRRSSAIREVTVYEISWGRAWVTKEDSVYMSLE